MPMSNQADNTMANSSIQSKANAQGAAGATSDEPPKSSLGQTVTGRNGKKGIEIQDELGRIVLVGKGLMEDWRKMQETLRTDMEK